MACFCFSFLSIFMRVAFFSLHSWTIGSLGYKGERSILEGVDGMMMIKGGEDGGLLWWFDHVERMESDRIAKRVWEMDWYCEGVFREKRFGCQPSKENGAGLVWMAGVCEGNEWGGSPGDVPLPLTICHNYMKPMKGRSPSVAETIDKYLLLLELSHGGQHSRRYITAEG